MSQVNLKGAVALVTGAGSGINFAFAKGLYERGCNVVIADLRLRPECEAMIDSFNRDLDGPRVIFQETDVTNWTHLEAAFDRVEKEFGTTADVVCGGAGIYEPVN